MKPLGAVLVSALLLILTACLPPPQAHYRRTGPTPCKSQVAPISNATIYVSIPVNFNYTPKDRPNGIQEVRQFVLDRLNQDGKANNNTFYLQNGSNLNFTFTFNYNNNNEIFTGSMDFAGWGWGDIHVFSATGQYNDPMQMASDLTDQAYAFISGGWHDATQGCTTQ